MNETRIDRLGRNYDITTSKRHSFGTDAIILAKFSDAPANGRICDLGTGCGIIPMLLSVWGIKAHVDAVDIQPDAIDMLNETVERNGLSDRIYPVCCDLKQLKNVLPRGCYDLVICNPPYRTIGSGAVCKDEGLRVARFEVSANISDVCLAGSKLLRTGGRLCICNRPDRLPDSVEAMRRSGFSLSRLRLVQQRSDGRAWLFLMEGIKSGKSQLCILPALIIEDNKGGYTPEMKDVYGEFAESAE
ncbi:MAG: tRNA1(Val) (adenine(37)-N6)-methyltransferase [Clostridia bacterium]|nr:tRNA1(Val) (adenine(37)-N6)-methyltransferase [Clostridia bacterium]